MRRLFWGAVAAFAVAVVGIAGLWWRLSSGPIELDVATPWLKAAIEQNFGGKQTVSVGGTQIERDENGRTSLRLRDIVVRDADGTVVASAPKAEVGISGVGLLTGSLRASSLNLVGAELSVRIETDGRVTVFAGANKRPIATAAATLPAAQPSQPAGSPPPPGALRAGSQDVAGLLGWIDGLGATGLDGHDLRELGLKNGNLIVDDQRNGKRWTFSRINVSLTRPHQGGVIFRLASDDPERPWVLSAAMRPLADGVRAVGIEARHVSSKDILLAMRLNEGNFDVDLPLSASVRAEILSDGTLQRLQGQVLADAGTIVDHSVDNPSLKIDHADIRFNWEARQRALVIPFQIQSGGNQFTLRAALEMPADRNGIWFFSLARGDPVIDPIILASTGKPDEEGFALNRVSVRARIDTVRHRVDLEQGDFSRVDTRPSHNIAVAVTGSVDYGGAEPHMAFGIAGTRMPDGSHDADVAGVHQRPLARVDRGPHFRRHRRARGGRRQCAAGELRPQWTAAARRRLVGRYRDERNDAASARHLTGNPRRRSYRAHHRQLRQYQPRPRHRGGDAGAQAQYREWRFRNTEYPPNC